MLCLVKLGIHSFILFHSPFSRVLCLALCCIGVMEHAEPIHVVLEGAGL